MKAGKSIGDVISGSHAIDLAAERCYCRELAVVIVSASFQPFRLHLTHLMTLTTIDLVA